MTEVVATNETILVVGGGISGMTAALEAAETGKEVVLVEKRPYLGGRVSQLYKYFPKLCFPTCGLEINQRRSKMNPNLIILAMAEVTDIKGEKGSYTASVKLSPRYVNENCTGCGDCAKVVEAEFDDEHNYGMSKRKGAYLPYRMAHPQRYVLDPAIIGTDDAQKARDACKYGAIDLDMAEEAKLGGVWADLYKRVPFRAAAADVPNGRNVDLPKPEDPGIDAMATEIEANAKIRVHLSAKISKTSGAPGRFSADISTESGSTITENFGAIVQASDYTPYDANKLPELGYGKTPDVVTNFELEKLAKEANGAPIKRPSDGKEVKSVAFIQCAGQRSTKEGHLPYCSGFCCTESIKQAMYFKEQNEGCDATVLFDDLRTPAPPARISTAPASRPWSPSPRERRHKSRPTVSSRSSSRT